MGEKHLNYSYVIHCLILNSDKVFYECDKVHSECNSFKLLKKMKV